MDPGDQFDPERLKLTKDKTLPATNRPRRQRQRRKEYLGSVPWVWLQVAAPLPGRALAIGLVLWHLKHLRKQWTVKWEPSKGKSLGLDRHAVYRGLKSLEKAGLIDVERRCGSSPVVTIHPPEDPANKPCGTDKS